MFVAIYQIYVEDFMVKNVKYIYLGMTYEELKNILKSCKQIKVFPLVDNAHNMILLGSIARSELIELIEKQIGYDRRLEIVKKTDELEPHEPKEEEAGGKMELEVFINKLSTILS